LFTQKNPRTLSQTNPKQIQKIQNIHKNPQNHKKFKEIIKNPTIFGGIY